MTQEQRDWLEKNNLDPTIYDVDAEGNVFENPVERMSRTRAALTSAAASTLPSLGGLAAAVPGMKAGAVLLAPLGPVGSAVGGVGGFTSSAAGAAGFLVFKTNFFSMKASKIKLFHNLLFISNLYYCIKFSNHILVLYKYLNL